MYAREAWEDKYDDQYLSPPDESDIDWADEEDRDTDRKYERYVERGY